MLGREDEVVVTKQQWLLVIIIARPRNFPESGERVAIAFTAQLDSRPSG